MICLTEQLTFLLCVLHNWFIIVCYCTFNNSHLLYKCCFIVQSTEMNRTIDLVLDLAPQAVIISFFHHKKTAISSQMVKPFTFLKQLQDHDLIAEDLYQARKIKAYFIPFFLYSWNKVLDSFNLLTLFFCILLSSVNVNVWSMFY